jgi:hypothetical protein
MRSTKDEGMTLMNCQTDRPSAYLPAITQGGRQRRPVLAGAPGVRIPGGEATLEATC